MAAPAQEAFESTSASVRDQVAIKLKANWPGIRVAASTAAGVSLKDKPSDTEFATMADELIDKRSLTLDNQTITLAQMNAALTADMKKQFGADNLDQLIPKRAQVNKIAKAVADGVEENPAPSLSNPASWASAIGGFLSALFSWMSNGFEGGLTGLMNQVTQNIAGNVAGNMENSVTANLAKLRQDDPTLTGFITDANIEAAGKTVKNTVMARAGIAPQTGDEIPKTLADTQIGDIAAIRETARNTMQTKLHDEISKGFEQNFPDAYAPKSLTQKTGDAIGMQGDTEKQKLALDDVAKKVSKRLSDIATSPDYIYSGEDSHLQSVKGQTLASMNPTDRARVMAAEARKIVDDERIAEKNPTAAAILAQVELALPDKIEESIVKEDKKIPWMISGHNDTNASLSTTTALDPNNPHYAEAKKAVEDAAKDMIAGRMRSEFISDPVTARTAGQLAGLPENAVLTDKQVDVIAAAIAPDAVDIMGKKDALKNDKDVVGKISRRFAEALHAKEEELNQNGIHLTDAGKQVIADQLAVKVAAQAFGKNGKIEVSQSTADIIMANEEKAASEIAEKAIITVDNAAPGGLKGFIKGVGKDVIFVVNRGNYNHEAVAKEAAEVLAHEAADPNFKPSDPKAREELSNAIGNKLVADKEKLGLDNMTAWQIAKTISGDALPKLQHLHIPDGAVPAPLNTPTVLAQNNAKVP